MSDVHSCGSPGRERCQPPNLGRINSIDVGDRTMRHLGSYAQGTVVNDDRNTPRKPRLETPRASQETQVSVVGSSTGGGMRPWATTVRVR